MRMGHRKVGIDRDRTLEQRQGTCAEPDNATRLHPALKACSASSDGVVASSSGVEYFSMVASDSPTRVRNRVAI